MVGGCGGRDGARDAREEEGKVCSVISDGRGRKTVDWRDEKAVRCGRKGAGWVGGCGCGFGRAGGARARRRVSEALVVGGLGVDGYVLPEDHLVPTVPSRVSYVVWVRELLGAALPGSSAERFLRAVVAAEGGLGRPWRTRSAVRGRLARAAAEVGVLGVDVGTGASAIYPVVAHALYGWSMVGTEVDAASAEWAERTAALLAVAEEGVRPVRVRRVAPGVYLRGVLGPGAGAAAPAASFTMCNPPFFGSAQRAADRHPARAREATASELVHSEGGELGFVGHLLEESAELRERAVWFTSLLGHRASLAPLARRARALGATLVRHTAFEQGRTHRWGIAWTFFPATDFRPHAPVAESFRIAGLAAAQALARVRQSLLERAAATPSAPPPTPLLAAGVKRPRDDDAEARPRDGDDDDDVDEAGGDRLSVRVDGGEDRPGTSFVADVHVLQHGDEPAGAAAPATPAAPDALDPRPETATTISFTLEAGGGPAARRAFHTWVAKTMVDVLRTGRKWRRRTQRDGQEDA
jgi:23S rRNA A1618 N6-methylase RlmF